MVSAATGGTPHSSAASSFSHRVMSLGGASATGCSVCTRGDRDGGGGGREGEGGGRVGLGWGGVWVRKERGRRAILSYCGTLSDFGPDPAGCPFRCCLKLLCGPPSGPVC